MYNYNVDPTVIVCYFVRILCTLYFYIFTD